MGLHNWLKNGGGSVWESNPPSRGLAPITGFEVQAAHQHRYASKRYFNNLEGAKIPGDSFVRVLSEIARKVRMRLEHTFVDILFVHYPVAIIHRIGLVASDLPGCLTWHTRSVHIPHRRSPGIVKELPWESSFRPCHPPGPVVVLNPLPLSVKT
jgi:hypothetical protein